ncbi:hypothetical protein F511_39872 [Dorcoceras hygrometricum]|uniref:Uncharacterized protein n=1 Tax=Dorcoceras hygrometricum TaxID=472368 RepID=A0A2Z7A9M2_9LAMI|nr:hypothetical protein F511_39872 [Dorcoceras hygrometricum]
MRRPPLIDRTCSDQFSEENPSALISSGLLVQADEGVFLPVVDLIDESTAAYREEPVFLSETVNSDPRQSTVNSDPRQSTATQIWTANRQLRSGKVNSALTKANSALATQIQLWRRKFRFGDVDSDLATQIQIWRRRFRFGDVNSDLVKETSPANFIYVYLVMLEWYPPLAECFPKHSPLTPPTQIRTKNMSKKRNKICSGAVEEHYLLVIQDIRDRAECQLKIFDQWHSFCTGYPLSKILAMKFVEEFEKTENKLFSWRPRRTRLVRCSREGSSSGSRWWSCTCVKLLLSTGKNFIRISCQPTKISWQFVCWRLDWQRPGRVLICFKLDPVCPSLIMNNLKRVASMELIPSLTWQEHKTQLAQLANPTLDKRMDRNKSVRAPDMEQPAPEEEDQPQTSSTHSSISLSPTLSGRFVIYSEDSEDNLSPSPSPSASPNLNLGPSPSKMQMVVYTEKHEEITGDNKEEAFTQAAHRKIVLHTLSDFEGKRTNNVTWFRTEKGQEKIGLKQTVSEQIGFDQSETRLKSSSTKIDRIGKTS